MEPKLSSISLYEKFSYLYHSGSYIEFYFSTLLKKQAYKPAFSLIKILYSSLVTSELTSLGSSPVKVIYFSGSS